MSIKNLFIGVLAVAIIVAGVFLFLQVSDTSPAPQATAAGQGKNARPGQRLSGARSGLSGQALTQAGNEATPDKPLPAPLTYEERKTMEMEYFMAGEVPQRIRRAASGCYDGSPFSYKQLENEEKEIELSFTVVLEKGQVRLDGVKLTGGIGQEDLEQCVVQMVSEITWRDKVNADFSAPMTDSISLLALKKWGAPMPHELEEVPEEPGNEDFTHGPR